jgi:ribonuclease D
LKDEQQKLYYYIEKDSDLKSLVSKIKKADRIAIDIEADSLHHFYEKVCLIQLTVDSGNFIVDPLAGLDLSEFLDTLAHRPLVVHDGGYDLRMLYSSLEFRPHCKVFDTMLAAQLLGFQRFGLGALLEHFFDLSHSKRAQKADWSRRPLSPNLLKYASDDTRYLVRLAEKLSCELRKLDRLSWHSQACERMVRQTVVKNRSRDTENAWRIKGASLLTRSELRFVKELYFWRLSQARKADRPSFKVMPNRLILELAAWANTNPRTPLKKGPKMPRDCRGKRLMALESAIRKAHDIPESDWPSRRKKSAPKRPVPDRKLLIQTLRDECSQLAAKLNIAPSILATRAAIAAVAYNDLRTIDDLTKSAPLMRWQAELLQPLIRKTVSKLNTQAQ